MLPLCLEGQGVLFVRSLHRDLLRFARAEQGAAAVEMAMIAAPFFWLLMGMFEVAMIQFAQTTLDYAMGETARQIRTGEFQMDHFTEAQVKARICSEMGRILAANCDDLYLDVDSYQGFVNVQNTNPVGPNGQMNTSGFGYSPGAPSAIVMVRGFYSWHVFTPFFQDFLANVGHTRLLTSTILFRNEPYATT